MKIIQSFWAAGQDPIKDNFGWHTPKYHWLSWILSANQLNKFYDVELYTDSVGYDILINKLQLPYTKVHLVLDELNAYPKGFWALPKIKTYSLQDAPFLHVDGDVFIWEPFPENLLSQNLITQNLEITTDYYHNIWKQIEPKLKYIPNEMYDYINGKTHLACNMGIVGGNDVLFFKQYSKVSTEFVDNNKAHFSIENQGNFNVFFEQVLFYLMAEKSGKKVSYLINEISKDNDYKEMGDFHKVPTEKTYLHLLGDYKRDIRVCRQLENYVLRFYPEFFRRLANLGGSFFPYFNGDLQDYGFSLDENKQRINAFSSIDNVNADYLLGRDLLSVREPILFIENIKKNKDFELEFLRGFYIREEHESEVTTKYIEIQELDKESSFIQIDNIDEMIFYQVTNTKQYFKILENMLLALDNEAINMKNQFLEMIKDRVCFFLTYKVLRIVG